MEKIIFEVCAGSYEDCIAAKNGKADRIELNSALHLGGLTPTTATLKKVKQEIEIPIFCMVRPRAAGFCYSDSELEIMYLEAKELLEAKADGIVFGFLNKDKTLDMEQTKKFVELIHRYGKEAVFHRAFDCVEDKDNTIRQLISLGVNRILTSGGEVTAIKGINTLKHLQTTYGKQINLLIGVGVNETNVKDLIKQTGISQVHSSCKGWKEDVTSSNAIVDYSYHEQHTNAYEVVEEEKVKAIKTVIETM